jgi:hypothetical protein
MPDHQAEITARVRSELPDVAHRVIEEEIRPVVRESITADTLRAISKMVALTPHAVAAIQEDLLSDNEVVRQRAYTLIMKYTVGHSALVQPPDQDRTQPLQIHFDLPRPTDAPDPEPDEPEPEVEDAEVVRECDTCRADKPESDFVANSDRCVECYGKQQERAAEIDAATKSD